MKKAKLNNIAKLDFWYKYIGTKLEDIYYGGNRKHYFEIDVSSINKGKRLKFKFLLDKELDMSGVMDEVYLEIYNKNKHDEYGILEKVYKLGDIPFDELEGMAIVLLKILKPELLNNKKLKEWIVSIKE